MNEDWRNELITKGAAFDALTEVESHYEFEDGHDHLLRWAKTKIFALTPEQPEIIRCKDCEYFITKRLRCFLREAPTAPDEFCSFAERREDE